MSYILDSLKKSQKPIADIDFSAQETSTISTDKSLSSPLVFSIKAIFAVLICFTAGFMAGNGIDVIAYALQGEQSVTEQNITETDVAQQEALQWPQSLTPHQDAAFFNHPERFNKKLFDKKRMDLLAQQQLEREQEKQKQQEQRALLAQQVEQVIKAKGLVMSSQTSQSTSQNQTQSQDSSTTQDENLSLDPSKLEGVSDELLAAFQSAIEEEDAQATPEQNINRDNAAPPQANATRQNNNLAIAVQDEIKPLTQMPQWFQNSIPPLHFTLHMYSSEQAKSWVRLNNQDYNPGDITHEGLVLEQVLPQKVVMQYQGKSFSLKALSTW